MSTDRPPQDVLCSILWKLSGFLPDLVVLGGWVPYLHRHYRSHLGWRSEPVFTEELDLLVDPPLRRSEGRTIGEALREAGFRPVGEGAAAAVWECEEVTGERIEFFVEHRGPVSSLSSVEAVRGAGGLGALSLRGLRLLREHSMKLPVPVGRHEGHVQVVDVTVPRLGAFMVHKAACFPRRPEGVKQAKDLFYLFEIMAAGDSVQADAQRGIEEIAAEPGFPVQEVRTGRYNLGSVLREDGGLRRLLELTAEMVSERYRIDMAAAGAQVEGYLRDLVEIFASAAAER